MKKLFVVLASLVVTTGLCARYVPGEEPGISAGVGFGDSNPAADGFYLSFF